MPVKTSKDLCHGKGPKKFSLQSFPTLRPDFTSKLVHVLTFGTPKVYIAPYDKIKHELVNLSSNCNVKSGLNVLYRSHFVCYRVF